MKDTYNFQNIVEPSHVNWFFPACENGLSDSCVLQERVETTADRLASADQSCQQRPALDYRNKTTRQKSEIGDINQGTKVAHILEDLVLLIWTLKSQPMIICRKSIAL